jgi:hypothetical protein
MIKMSMSIIQSKKCKNKRKLAYLILRVMGLSEQAKIAYLEEKIKKARRNQRFGLVFAL